MGGLNNGECQKIINQVQDYIKTKTSDKEATLLTAFAQRYFSSSAVDDLKERSIADLYGILIFSLEFYLSPHTR